MGAVNQSFLNGAWNVPYGQRVSQFVFLLPHGSVANHSVSVPSAASPIRLDIPWYVWAHIMSVSIEMVVDAERKIC